MSATLRPKMPDPFESRPAEESAVSGAAHIIGRSPRIQRIFRFVSKIAPTESAVLITGESGTGKELVARAIHYQSRRAHRPFVAVNCGALPENLLESEFFGHVKGAFTGAKHGRTGSSSRPTAARCSWTRSGSMPPIQVKLLRVLQEGEVRRVGAKTSVRVDVRVVSATNRDLAAMEQGASARTSTTG